MKAHLNLPSQITRFSVQPACVGDAAQEVRVAGRVIARRVMGKLAFVTLRDDSGTIQLYVDKSRLESGADGFKQLKGLVDVGDFLGASGTMKRTDKGELSVVTKWLQVRLGSLGPNAGCTCSLAGTTLALEALAAILCTMPCFLETAFVPGVRQPLRLQQHQHQQ